MPEGGRRKWQCAGCKGRQTRHIPRQCTKKVASYCALSADTRRDVQKVHKAGPPWICQNNSHGAGGGLGGVIETCSARSNRAQHGSKGTTRTSSAPHNLFWHPRTDQPGTSLSKRQQGEGLLRGQQGLQLPHAVKHCGLWMYLRSYVHIFFCVWQSWKCACCFWCYVRESRSPDTE